MSRILIPYLFLRNGTNFVPKFPKSLYSGVATIWEIKMNSGEWEKRNRGRIYSAFALAKRK